MNIKTRMTKRKMACDVLEQRPSEVTISNSTVCHRDERLPSLQSSVSAAGYIC